MITDKLIAIQQALKAPKGQYNSFGGYNYRSCEDILEAVKPILAKEKVALTISDEIVEVGGRIYVKATATLHDPSDANVIARTSAYAREEESKKGMDAAQLTGATSSYARKYALNGLFAIDDNKDADDDSLSPRNPANEIRPEPRAVPTAATVTPMATLPPTPKEEAPAPAVSLAKQYLAAQVVAMREALGMTSTEYNKIFKKRLEALVNASLAPDKKIDDYTIEEAEALVDAMNRCFDPRGTELKTQ
jgi:hypothetical protein